MNIRLASADADAQLWNDFVDRHAECGNYHRWGWKEVIERSFRWPTFYLMDFEGDRAEGILPLVWQKSWMFGSFMTSLPFLNSGGAAGSSQSAKDALVAEAVAIAKRNRADYLELRHRSDPALNLPVKTHKVAMILPLHAKEEDAWNALPHKVRTDIRKSMKTGLQAELGGAEFLDTFYEIFAHNMRDLGTPVYSKVLFSEIFKAFPNDSFICVVRHQGKAVAVSFLSGYRDSIEALWSSSLYEFASLKPNMFLYWSILRFAAERGYKFFDFGRSSVGSGTHRFKKQWGSQEVPLHWVYWVPDGAQLPEVNNENPRYRVAIEIWKKLPVGVTKVIGPPIVKRLP